MTEIGRSEAELSLSDKMARHLSAYVTTVKSGQEGLRSNDQNRMTKSSLGEQEARRAIFLHRPTNDVEKDRKLTYIVALLIASKGTLEPEELGMILEKSKRV